MLKELKFIDPAFTCEVVLGGALQALYETARSQFERLKEIKSLGIVSHTSDIAMHTRHHHLVGLMRLFNKLCQQPKSRGLPKKFLWSFWCRLCFGQTGHAAFAYDSEKAVLLACHTDPAFKVKFATLLQPVINRLSACPVCEKSCEAKDKNGTTATFWFDDMIQRNRWRRVYLWIAALKLVQDPKVIAILNQQVAGQENALGFSEPEALKMLVCPECRWDTVFLRLNRLDYVVRDLAFAGTLGIQVDVDNLISAADQNHPDWRLLRSLDDYLSENLYESIPMQTASVFFQRALATAIIERKISLEDLFGMDPESALDDNNLKVLLQRVKAGREVFDSDIRNGWRTWPISSYVDEKSIPCEIEKAITGQTRLHLSGHTILRVTCLKLKRDHTLGLAICHRSHADRPTAKAFVKLCRSILLKQYPRLDADGLTTALYEGLVDRKCEHGLESGVERFSKLDVPPEVLQGAAKAVNARRAVKTPLQSLSVRIGGIDYPFSNDPDGMLINAMHAAVMGGDVVQKNLGISIQGAAQILWKQILDWQSVYFGLLPSKRILRLVETAQSGLAKEVVTGSPNAEADLELYTLLESLRHPTNSVSFRIALPNLKLLREDKTPENEYDVVSVILKEDKDVEVWIWGVTTHADISRKRAEDHSKIQRLKDHLGNRWGGEVRTVENYVHKDGNDICLEIDGRQEKRSISG